MVFFFLSDTLYKITILTRLVSEIEAEKMLCFDSHNYGV